MNILKKLQTYYYSDQNLHKMVIFVENMIGLKYDVKYDATEFNFWDQVRDKCFMAYEYNKKLEFKNNLIVLNKLTCQKICEIIYEKEIKPNKMPDIIKPEYTNNSTSVEEINDKVSKQMEERGLRVNLNVKKEENPVFNDTEKKVEPDLNLEKRAKEYEKQRQLDLLKFTPEEPENINFEKEDLNILNSDNSTLDNYFDKNDNASFMDKDHVLIQKPDNIKEKINEYHDQRKIEKEYYVLVDSRSRDYGDYPNPNNYHIELEQTYKDILEIELISANIPKSEYNINNSNNVIHFDVSGTEYTAVLPVGNYILSDLLTDLETQMNGSGSGVTFSITENTKTNKITISGSAIFTLLFNGGSEPGPNNSTRSIYKESSIGYNLGFSRVDLSGLTAYTGTMIYDISGENYVLLYIRGLENLETSSTGVSGIGKSFTKINLNTDFNTVKFYSKNNDYYSNIFYTTPKASLYHLEIKFYSYNGSLYDFNGLEHSLQFKIKTLGAGWKS